MSPAIGLTWLVGLLLVMAPFLGRRFASGAVVVSLLGVVGGVAAAIQGLLSVADALALASLSSCALLSLRSPGWKRVALLLGGTILLVAGATTQVGGAPATGGHLEVFLGCWAAFWAAYGFLVVQLANNERFANGMALSAALSAAAVSVLVTSRSSLGGWGFYVFLDGDAGSLLWELPVVEKLPGGLRLEVAQSLPPWVFVMVVLAAAVALAVAILGPALPKKVTIGGLILVALMGATGALVPLQAESNALPETQRYEDYARQSLARVGADPQLASQGRFNSETVVISRARQLPELTLLLLLTLWAVLGAAVSLGWLPLEPTDENLEGRVSVATKTAAFIWLAWVTSGVAQWLFIGTVGMRSPSEWWMTGMALMATGALLATLRMGDIQRAWACGFIVGLLAWLVALNVTFGSFPGLSVGLF